MSSADSATTTPAEPPETAPGLGQARAVLRPRKARPFFGRHPWVLDSAIDRLEGSPAPGDVVDLLTDKGKFVARGIFNPQSRIRLRLYTWSPGQPLDEGFWQAQIARAVAWRRQLGYDQPQGAARLVFSEADGISGLIVDRYGEYLSVQTTALAMAQRLPMLVPLLVAETGARGVVVRHERGTAQAEGIEAVEGVAWGKSPEGPVFIEEHGLRYGVDLREGQKTGFYLDQRENRRAAAAYLRGRHVLDVCCYSGGFGLCALALGGAREVMAIDTSERATALARANAELNGLAINTETGDAFALIDRLASEGRRFGGVILDPPKFARSRQSLPDALRAYHRLNRRAVDLLEPDGILVSCSCTGQVTREDFLDMLAGVAQQTGRDVQILEQRGAAPDHPVSASCLETEYLKCFICRVG